MFPTPNLATPYGIFILFVEVVVIGLVIGAGLWVINTYITPNLPEPFKWVANILVGLFLLALLFALFFAIF